MAADILSAHGLEVILYERKPSLGRKLLMAGRGGLNLTHSEDIDSFIQKYRKRAEILGPVIRAFPPQALREWCEGLGEKTFVGSSGRVFPESFKASPLLRAWIKRLERQGVRFMLGHEWRGWRNNLLVFQTAEGKTEINADAALLALGGASWPRLGSDGMWVDILQKEKIKIAPLQPANCGFFVDWSEIFSKRFSGKPLKTITASFKNNKDSGEIMIAREGIEGGAIYALSSLLREEINASGSAVLYLDLKPGLSLESLADRLKKPRARKSFSNYLRSSTDLSDVAIGLLMESPERTMLAHYAPEKLAALIKNYPLHLRSPFSIERAISTAGGVIFDSVNESLMLLEKPGVFVAGEMLDWDAPTGGYLLQASFATGTRAAHGIIDWLRGEK
ncbi:MAG TPA: aminoacetone oxidase family FAD-binding enzyme [Rhodospirillaceae bacterium]|nr:aminoacetone oxidase family FAD-binding enzyme [Rhodospirillaceae bacterium]